MKQEVGFEHYEGRSWIGLHHHLTICMAAHAFLACQRKLSPPQTA
jgi:SRSO17 transposase